jgi:hypothetical protein
MTHIVSLRSFLQAGMPISWTDSGGCTRRGYIDRVYPSRVPSRRWIEVVDPSDGTLRYFHRETLRDRAAEVTWPQCPKKGTSSCRY